MMTVSVLMLFTCICSWSPRDVSTESSFVVVTVMNKPATIIPTIHAHAR